ncbi:MAG TPA: caspase family protein [Thermoanaerobaculia bacterium]
MPLILDRRDTLTGPGLHLFIAGVSAYEFLPGSGSGVQAEKTFGLKQLTATAATAWLVWKKLEALDAAKRLRLPLATVHLLLSPSATEVAKHPELEGLTPRCTRRNFSRDAKAWRTCATASNDDATLFYFAGHGVQRRQQDAVLLMDDFGDPDEASLTNCVDVHDLFNGMAPPQDVAASIARRQMYFVDACRMPSGEFQQNEWMRVPSLWDVGLSGVDDRVAPKFYATIPGASAFAVGGEQTLFSFALFEALDRLAATGPKAGEAEQRWRVTAASLRPAVEQALAKVADQHRGEQQFTTDGALDDQPIAFYDKPPDVDVVVTIEPETALPFCELDVLTARNKPHSSLAPIAPHPVKLQLAPGVWGFRARIKENPPQPFEEFFEFVKVELPSFPLVAKVKP